MMSGLVRFWFSDFKPVILDFDPFYHARIAGTIYSDGRIPKWDPLELGGIPHYYPPGYHLLIVLGKYVTPEADFIAMGSILTAFLGVLSALLLYVIARELGRGVALVSVALYCFAPIVVFRSGLVARPTGLSILLTMLVLYALLKLLRNDRPRNRVVYVLALLGYMLSHGSVVVTLAFVLIVLCLKPKRKVLTATAIPVGMGLIYYYPVLGALNFSAGITTESMPLFSIEDFLLKEPLNLLVTLSVYGIVFLPLVFHGAYVFKSRRFWLLLTAFSFSTAFFKLSIFLLFIFALFIAMAASLSRLQHLKAGKIRAGWSLAAFVFISALMTNAYMLYSLQGLKVNSHVEPLREFLEGIEFQEGALILANDLNPGHEIAYYSGASVFMSDLSDVKKWDENYETFKELLREDLPAERAVEILKTHRINYILVLKSSKQFPFLQGSKSSFILLKENEYAALYLLT